MCNIWESGNFLELFYTNVHSQDASDLQKFNYFISYLKGEPLRAINKFQIIKDNYQKSSIVLPLDMVTQKN